VLSFSDLSNSHPQYPQGEISLMPQLIVFLAVVLAGGLGFLAFCLLVAASCAALTSVPVFPC
jgi:hypothetical protein